MKKAICLTSMCLFLITVIATPILAKKAGEIKDDIYTDAQYKFNLKIPAGWASTVKDEKSALRFVLTHKSYAVPQQFQGNPEYAQIPTINILVDTTSLSVDQFIDSLLEGKTKSKQKTFFLKYMPLIAKTHDVLKRSPVTVGDAKWVAMEVRQAYTVEVAQAGSDVADVVQDYKSGQIYLTVKNGYVFVIHGICEYKLNSTYKGIFDGFFSTWKFE
jgi:hypothetical protein